MKFTLTISDAAPSDLNNILALIAANVPAINGDTGKLNYPMAAIPLTAPAMPTPPANNDDDDDNSPPNENAPAVDSNGLPWDERIHSSNKGLNKDGSWRMRRGVHPEIVKQVEAELQSKTPLQDVNLQQNMTEAAPAPQPTMPAAMPQMPPAPANEQPQPTMPAMPQMPPAQEPVAAPQPTTPPAPAAPVSDFMSFMQGISRSMQMQDANGAPLIDPTYLARIAQEISTAYQLASPLTAITDLNKPEFSHMVPYAVQLLQRDGKWI